MPQVMLNSHIGQWCENNEVILRSHFPLHRACRDGDVDQVSLLLRDSQCTLIEEDSIYGWTPFHWASQFGKLDCLRRLLSLLPGGQNIISSKFKQSPVHTAALAGQFHCLHYLIQVGANLNLQDYMGETPLHKSARSGNTECASLLVAMGADNSVCNLNGQTPSQLAFSCGHMTLANHLASVQLNSQNHTGIIGSNNGISNGFPIRNYDNNCITKPNGFTLAGLDEINRINGSLGRRKRSMDSWGNENGKRIRTLEPEGFQDPFAPSLMSTITFGAPPAFMQQEPSNPSIHCSQEMSVGGKGTGIMDSMIEHQTLCNVERGYNSMLLESIISQMHGC